MLANNVSDPHQSNDPVVLRNKKRCRVLFSYQPVHEDELELKVDQVVEFMGEVEDGWWKGRSEGRVGVFPSNFVEMCNNNSEEKPAKFHSLVDDRSMHKIPTNNLIKEQRPESTKEEIIQKPKPVTPPSNKLDDNKKMSTSQRSQFGQSSPPPDTAPRLPPKPGKKQHY